MKNMAMFGSQHITLLALTLLSAFVTSTAIRVILHTRLVYMFIDPPDHRKMHTAPIPRVGGIAIILAMVAVTLVWHALSVRAGGVIAELSPDIFKTVLAAAAAIGVLGYFDDSKFVSVRVREKLIVVIGLALATVFVFGVSPGAIDVFGLFVIPKFYSDVIAVLWIIGLVNAYNLVDGLDGFAGTIAILSLLGIIAVSYLCGCGTIAVLGFFAAGATLGFMRHNLPPAKVFMGDTGSCFLGFLIAVMTIRTASLMGQAEGCAGKVPLVMPLLAGLPILEVFVTIARRYFKANESGHPIRQILKHIVTADSSHIHHRYLFRGFSHLETCVLVGVLAATIVGGAVAIMLAPLRYAPFVAAYILVPITATLYKLGFGGRFKKALKISASRLNSYHKPALIGVIDTDGTLFNYLSGMFVKGFAFVPLVNSNDLPMVAGGLSGAIVRGGYDLPEMEVGIVRELSSRYGFSPMPYSEARDRYNIVVNRKAAPADTEQLDKALRRFANGRAR